MRRVLKDITKLSEVVAIAVEQLQDCLNNVEDDFDTFSIGFDNLKFEKIDDDFTVTVKCRIQKYYYGSKATETRNGKIEVEFSGWTSLEIRGKKVFVDDYIFPRISRYLKRNHKDLIYDLFE